MKPAADIGVVGMAVMGQNLALNIESRGYTVAVFNRTAEVTKDLAEGRFAGRRLVPGYTLRDFARSLKRPRRAILMVKAGAAVDAVMDALLPFLDRGDILMDGGNTHYPDTERREAQMAKRGIRFIGMGISGGEYGALHGPSIMPGGDRSTYALVRPMLVKAAARTEYGSCCTLVGRSSAGHFTKMVHNGIEYAVMQELAEVWDLMRTGLGMSVKETQEVFARWDAGRLNSYLVEISAKVTDRADPETGRPLVEVILDRAEQKGTGKWTSQAALDFGVPVPTITAAVDARIMSGHRRERLEASRLLGGASGRVRVPRARFVSALEWALAGGMLAAYAQGMHLLARASREKGYGINLAEACRIWTGGCIIRSRMLGLLMKCYRAQPGLEFLPLSRRFAAELARCAAPLRLVVGEAQKARIPVPALSSALAWRDTFARKRLPAALTQAQRDYFGAHTYERTDRPGYFHTDWEG